MSAQQIKHLAYKSEKDYIRNVNAALRNLSHWHIFPFKVSSGVVYLTETGFKPHNSNMYDYSQVSMIITGDEFVSCTWEDSTKLYIKKQGDEFYTRDYTVGKDIKAYVLSESLSGSMTKGDETVFTEVNVGRNIDLYVTGEYLHTFDPLKLFIILNDTNEQIGDPHTKSRLVMYIASFRNIYSPFSNKRIIGQVITFVTLNDKLNQSASGETISSYVQFASAIGDGYAFPRFVKVDSDEDDKFDVHTKTKLALDMANIRPVGVKYVNRQALGGEAYVYTRFRGRPVLRGDEPAIIVPMDGKVIYRDKVYAPRVLGIAGNNDASVGNIKNGGVLMGIADELSDIGGFNPSTNVYRWEMGAKATGVLHWKDFQTMMSNWEGNFWQKKEFSNILDLSSKGYNFIHSNPHDLPFYDSNLAFYEDADMDYDLTKDDTDTSGNLTEGKDFALTTGMNPFFTYIDKENNRYGMSLFTWKYIPEFIENGETTNELRNHRGYANLINWHSFLYYNITSLPYSTEQYLPFSLFDVPIVGKMLQAISGGIPLGFAIKQGGSSLGTFNFCSFFMPEFYGTLFAQETGTNQGDSASWMEISHFDDTKSGGLAKQVGFDKSNTSELYKLSDRVELHPYHDIIDSTVAVDSSSETDYPLFTMSTIHLGQFIDLDTPYPELLHEGQKTFWGLTHGSTFSDTSQGFSIPDTELRWHPTTDGTQEDDNYAFVIDAVEMCSIAANRVNLTFYTENPYDNPTVANVREKDMVARIALKSYANLSGNLLNWKTIYKTSNYETLEEDNKYFQYPQDLLPPYEPYRLQDFPNLMLPGELKATLGLVNTPWPAFIKNRGSQMINMPGSQSQTYHQWSKTHLLDGDYDPGSYGFGGYRHEEDDHSEDIVQIFALEGLQDSIPLNSYDDRKPMEFTNKVLIASIKKSSWDDVNGEVANYNAFEKAYDTIEGEFSYKFTYPGIQRIKDWKTGEEVHLESEDYLGIKPSNHLYIQRINTIEPEECTVNTKNAQYAAESWPYNTVLHMPMLPPTVWKSKYVKEPFNVEYSAVGRLTEQNFTYASHGNGVHSELSCSGTASFRIAIPTKDEMIAAGNDINLNNRFPPHKRWPDNINSTTSIHTYLTPELASTVKSIGLTATMDVHYNDRGVNGWTGAGINLNSIEAEMGYLAFEYHDKNDDDRLLDVYLVVKQGMFIQSTSTYNAGAHTSGGRTIRNYDTDVTFFSHQGHIEITKLGLKTRV